MRGGTKALSPAMRRFLTYYLIIVFLELIQNYMGQPYMECLRDCFHFSFGVAYLVTSRFAIIGIFLVYAYEMTETCSYVFTGQRINYVFVSSLDPFFPIRAGQWGLFFMGLFPVVLVFLIVWAPQYFFPDEKREDDQEGKDDPHMHTPFCVFLIFLQMRGYLLVDRQRGEEPWFNTAQGVLQFKKLRDYFMSPITARFKPGVKPKNVIDIIPESFERQCLGEYNMKGYTKSMPYMSKLTREATFFPNASVGSWTCWSAGSVFASQCGIPLLSSPGAANNAQILSRIKQIKCVGDYTRVLGYRNVAMYPGDAAFGGIKPVLMAHGFDTFFDYKDGVRYDAYIINKFRKELKKSADIYHKDGTPFYMFVGLEDTHPTFRISCKVRSEYTAGPDKNKCIRAFDCVDQRIELMMNMLRDNGLTPENTIVVIHGDHPLMRTFPEYSKTVEGPQEERKMAYIWPFKPANRTDKWVTSYDVSPTILSELQVEYSPEFPFGRSMFDSEPGENPLPAATDYLWKYLNLV